MTRHVMFDLETWGKTPGSDIRSIGAVVFDPTTGNIGNWRDGWPGVNSQFYIATENPVEYKGGITTPYALKYPLTRDLDTEIWWSEQSPEAQAAFANPVDLHKACSRFAYWLCELTETKWFQPAHNFKPSENIRLWSNGPQFDVSILDAAYRAVGLPVPWHYRAPRDMRTIVDAAGMTRDDFAPFNHGTAHNALDDAISQAKIVCEAYKRLGLQK